MAAHATTAPAAGEILAGKYRVEKVLGVGGMGVVLAATHLHLDERVAMKLLHPSFAADEIIVGRFLREGKATIRIRSEHVVRVLDVGLLESGVPFMVMELLDGRDLDHVLRATGAQPIGPTVDLLLQACEALAEAHAQGMVHRDLKPANLFLTTRADGSPLLKVLDFGISKVTGAGGADLGVTKTSAVMGSPLYMAPEQMRSMRSVDARTDIWALGTILHQLLVGRPPFDAQTMPELCAAILEQQPQPLTELRPDAPPAVEAIILRCMAKDPAERFPDVAHLAAALVPHGSSATAAASAARIARILQVAVPEAGVVGTSPMAISIVDAAPRVQQQRTALVSPPVGTPPPGAPPQAATGTTWGQTDPRAARTAPIVAIVVGAVAVLGVVAGGGALFFSRRAASATSAPSFTTTASAPPIAAPTPEPEPAITTAEAPPTHDEPTPSAAIPARAVAPRAAAARPAPTPSAQRSASAQPKTGLFDDRK